MDTRPSGVPTPCRIPEPDRTCVEIAPRLAGLSRSAYIARAAMERAERDPTQSGNRVRRSTKRTTKKEAEGKVKGILRALAEQGKARTASSERATVEAHRADSDMARAA